MFRARGSPPRHEQGQGLVEYALILMLVGIVVIIILVLFGETVQKTYCQIVYSVYPDADIDVCETIDVACNFNTGNHWINLEAVVTDTMDDDDIANVKFYRDGQPVRTEYYVPYCLGGNPNDQPYCSRYYPPGGAGQYKIVAIATDADGNTGQCEATVTVP